MPIRLILLRLRFTGTQTCIVYAYFCKGCYIAGCHNGSGWSGSIGSLSMTNSVSVAGSELIGYCFSYSSGSSVHPLSCYSYYQGNSGYSCGSSSFCSANPSVTCSTTGWVKYICYSRPICASTNLVTLNVTYSTTYTRGDYVDTVQTDSSTAYTSGTVNSDGYWYEYVGTN